MDFCWSFFKKIVFSNNLIDWIKILLTIQESCFTISDSITSYFKLEKGVRQGDPVSTYLFIIALEIIFVMLKGNSNIKILKIFSHDYLYSVYADETTFF